ncbi:hypothetical protein HDU92_000005 [Lobulomyces angularis]|nr:hypothetical protein HDU92_000005 [Lobulomyces angularis]
MFNIKLFLFRRVRKKSQKIKSGKKSGKIQQLVKKVKKNRIIVYKQNKPDTKDINDVTSENTVGETSAPALIEHSVQNNKKNSPGHSKIPYSAKEKILLVGEGDFSFSSSLIQLLNNASNVIATSFDSEKTVAVKYPNSRAFIDHILNVNANEEDFENKGKILFDVDCTKLEKYKKLKEKRFDKIIFNFPHLGKGIKDQNVTIIEHQKLLEAFFKSASPKLASKMQFNDESDEPYDEWDIKKVAKLTGLKCKTSFAFSPELYPVYRHQRTLGYQEGVSVKGNEEILKSTPRTFVFVLKEVFIPEHEKGSAKKLKSKKVNDDDIEIMDEVDDEEKSLDAMEEDFSFKNQYPKYFGSI